MESPQTAAGLLKKRPGHARPPGEPPIMIVWQDRLFRRAHRPAPAADQGRTGMAEQDIAVEGLSFARQIFEDIASLTKDPAGGYTREGYSAKENEIHDYFKKLGRSLKLEEKTDPAGNLYLTLPGRHRELSAFMSGSHADSVPQGGNYDGLAGIVAPLTCLWWMEKTGFRPQRDVTVLVTRMEESSYFGKPYVGTMALTGKLRPEDLQLRHRTRNETLGEAITRAGFRPEEMVTGRPLSDLGGIAAFVELHIEQGPRLDSKPVKRIGVVTGIRGNLRHKAIRCVGETAHSGAVDYEFRHDAVLATAELLMSMEKHWIHRLDRQEDLVFTSGVVKTDPSASITKVPGLVTFCIDMRSQSMGTLERFHEMLVRDTDRIAKKRGVRFEFDKMLRTECARLNPRLVAKIANTAAAHDIPFLVMPSGAGHDAAVMANAGVPSAMIFVANQKGSHNPNEDMKIEDFMQGVKLLLLLIENYDL